MMELPILSLLILLPLVGAFFLSFMGEGKGSSDVVAQNARLVGLWTSGVTFLLSLVILFYFDKGHAGFQLVEKHPWIPNLNFYYFVGVDGLSLPFIVLTTFLMPLCILSTYHSVQKNVRAYVIAFLILESLIIGSFLALDIILFYIFFESVLIPMFIIIGIWGGARRLYATFKFFLYTLAGSVFLLLGFIMVYNHTGSTLVTDLIAAKYPVTLQLFLWPAFFLAFAIKLPLWPFHTWLPDAHVEAPTGGSVVLAGVLLKMGGYGILRFLVPMFPEASYVYAPYAFALAVAAVVSASLVALVQKDIKKLIAYSSVAHMGFVVLGALTFTASGLNGAIFQMVSHGFTSSALFFCVGVLYDRFHTREIADYQGLIHKMPYFSGFLFLFTLGSIGLPLTSGFVGEILVLIGVYGVFPIVAAIAGTGMIFGAGYMLFLYKRIIFGNVNEMVSKGAKALHWQEVVILTLILLPVIFLGLYPKAVLSITDIYSSQILQKMPKSQ